MDIRINGKTLLLGFAIATSYAFADYVVTIEPKGYVVIDNDGSNAPYIIDSGQTDNGGYIEWSNGYKEAWGNVNDEDIVTFPVTFNNVNTLNIQLTRHSEPGDLSAVAQAQEITASKFKARVNGGTASDPIFWSAKGF